MATVIESIGTGQDFSTVTLWEADLANKNSIDDIIGEMINQAFDEQVTLNNSTPNSVVLSVEASNRHDGTAGTGARNVASSARTWFVATPNNFSYTLEWIEFDANSNAGPSINGESASPNDVSSINTCLIHDQNGGNSFQGFIIAATRDLRVMNCIAYVNVRSTSINYGLQLDSDKAPGGCLNNTIWGVENASGDAHGIRIFTDSTNGDVKNNISAGHTAPSGTANAFIFAGSTNVDSDFNLSDDLTADDGGGSNNVISASAIDFVSTVGGSEDLHLNSESSDAHGVGVDLGTTPSGVEIDIDNTNRDTDIGADAWDIGADQFVPISAGAQVWPSPTKQMAHLINR